jgi:hypothetical protein
MDIYNLLKAENLDESLKAEGIRNNASLESSSAAVVQLL